MILALRELLLLLISQGLYLVGGASKPRPQQALNTPNHQHSLHMEAPWPQHHLVSVCPVFISAPVGVAKVLLSNNINMIIHAVPFKVCTM